MTFQAAKLKAAKLWKSDENRYGLTFLYHGNPELIYRGLAYEGRIEDLAIGMYSDAEGWDVRFTTEQEFWKVVDSMSWAIKGPNYFYC